MLPCDCKVQCITLSRPKKILLLDPSVRVLSNDKHHSIRLKEYMECGRTQTNMYYSSLSRNTELINKVLLTFHVHFDT